MVHTIAIPISGDCYARCRALLQLRFL